MKNFKSMLCVVAVSLLTISGVASADPGKDATCTNTKKNVPTCQKPSSATEEKSSAMMTRAKRAKCVFTCSKSDGIWVCRGNGPQCNGTSPWD